MRSYNTFGRSGGKPAGRRFEINSSTTSGYPTKGPLPTVSEDFSVKSMRGLFFTYMLWRHDQHDLHAYHIFYWLLIRCSEYQERRRSLAQAVRRWKLSRWSGAIVRPAEALLPWDPRVRQAQAQPILRRRQSGPSWAHPCPPAWFVDFSENNRPKRKSIFFRAVFLIRLQVDLLCISLTNKLQITLWPTGNMWAQSWEALFPVVSEFPAFSFDVTDEMKKVIYHISYKQIIRL